MNGLDQRFLRYGVYHLLDWALTDLGWFGDRRHRPVTLLFEPLNWDEPVDPNLIGFELISTPVEELELGNVQLTRARTRLIVTALVENASLGLELAGDISAILTGSLPSIGRERGVIELLDYRQATPPVIGYVSVDGVIVDEPASHTKRDWRQHWYTVECVLTLDGDLEV